MPFNELLEQFDAVRLLGGLEYAKNLLLRRPCQEASASFVRESSLLIMQRDPLNGSRPVRSFSFGSKDLLARSCPLFYAMILWDQPIALFK